MELTEEQMQLLNDTSIAGIPSLLVENVETEIQAKILEVEPVPTKWGTRIEYTIMTLDGYEHKISSWNFIMKKRIKPIDLVGKDILLKPYSEKKLLLEVI